MWQLSMVTETHITYYTCQAFFVAVTTVYVLLAGTVIQLGQLDNLINENYALTSAERASVIITIIRLNSVVAKVLRCSWFSQKGIASNLIYVI